MIKLWLKRIFFRLKYHKKKVKIGSGVELDTQNSFEGYNVLAKNCSVTSSHIGRGSYISSNSVIRKASIGKFCSIGSNVQTGLGTHPVKDFVSTHPAFFSTQQQAGFTFVDANIFDEHIFISPKKKYVVEIGNDVWIGSNVLITDGLRIGNGAVIAAGAVVTKHVPAYAIVGGVPAKIIRYRFTDEQIARLETVQWWDWELSKIKEQSELFNNIDLFLAKA